MISLAILASAAGLAAPQADPLAGTENWVLCFEPDVAAKRCDGMARYVREGDVRYAQVSLTPLQGMHGAAIETRSVVSIRNGAICEQADLAKLRAGKLLMDGKPVAAAKAAPIMRQVEIGYRGIAGKEICVLPESNGVAFVGRVLVNGARVPELDRAFRWVHNDDGFSMAGWQTLTAAGPVHPH
ncbi:MAG: hypothetical protein ACREBO_13730 [Novosphingobium sp.]